MNDRNTPNAVTDATRPDAVELLHLYRMVEGLLDADLLLAEEGEALLEALTAALSAVDGRDLAATRRHTRRFVQTLEAVVQGGLFDEAHGRATLETARRMLNDVAG